jgi:hypothetical protein
MAYDVRDFQIVGGWIETDHYHVTAKVSPEDEKALPAAGLERTKQMRLRLQALLAERFQLQIHRETREQSEYSLVVGKDDDSSEYILISAEGIAAKHKPVPDPPVLVAPATGTEHNTVIVPPKAVACCSLTDLTFEFDASFVMPGAQIVLSKLTALRQACHTNGRISAGFHFRPCRSYRQGRIQ